MRDEDKTREQLMEELALLRQRLHELETFAHPNTPQGAYCQIPNNAVEGYYQTTPSGQLSRVNTAFARLLGYDSPDDLLEQTTTIAQLYRDANDWPALAHRLAQNGEVLGRETQICRRDGQPIWISEYVRIRHDPHSGRPYYEGSCIDITPRKQAELDLQQANAALAQANTELEQRVIERTAALQAANDDLVAEIVDRTRAEANLRRAKEQLEAILDAVPGIVSWVSTDRQYLGVNRRLAELFHLPREAFVGQDIGFLGVSPDFEQFVADFFERPDREACQEIRARIDDEIRHFLIVAQKYDHDRAAFVVGIDITAQRRAEAALRDSKEQLEAILEAVPGIVSWISADQRYLGVNRRLAELYQLPREAFVGQDIGFLGSSHEFKQFVQDFFASPDLDGCREIAAIVNGELRNFLIVVQKYNQGQAAFAVGMDITERRRAEAALHTTKDQLEAILEAVPGFVSWVSDDLHYLGVNRYLAEMFDLPREAFVGQPIGFLGSSHDFNRFVQDFFASPSWETSQEISAIVRGEQRHFLMVTQKYNEGKAAFFIGIDITERLRMEAALREAEEKYRGIFENAIEGIFQTTIDGRYLSANPALARMYGYDSPADLMTHLTDIGEQLYVDPQRRTEFSHLMQTQGAVADFESEVYRRDGTRIWISENARVVTDETGQILRYEGTVEDITERKRAQMALQQANERLEERVEQRTAALREVNHRLRVEIAERRQVELALRNSEAELRALFAAMTDVIAVFDADGRYLKMVTTNSKLPYNPHEARVGRTVHEVLPPELAQCFLTYIRQVLATKTTYSLEYSMPMGSFPQASSPGQAEAATAPSTPDVAWFSANVSPINDNMVVWVARNITERKRSEEALRQEQEKSERLLLNILPQPIAEQLKQKQDQTLIAERFEQATILFADIVDFTGLASNVTPVRLVRILNQIFSTFDHLAERYGLEKIKTIGDAYMVVGGLPAQREDHAEAVADMALAMQQAITCFRRDNQEPFKLRIGMNTGPVVAGVIGLKKFAYDLWGDTVNIASRMEFQGIAGKIQVTEATYQRLRDRYHFEYRGEIEVKGRGPMTTYWLVGKRNPAPDDPLLLPPCELQEL
ncbi:adenylate/guanylate cyclase domain-containing protein [Trichothermofontia sp.]